MELNYLACVDAGGERNYALLRYQTLEPLDALPLHVLARAYRAAWRDLYDCEPRGQHPIAALQLLIVFQG